MLKMLRQLKQFMANEDGMELMEWGMVAGLISTAAFLTFQTISNQIDVRFTELLSNLLIAG